jgi:protein-L-isoaspartate(D-aspartate) O-methyltransferase
MAVEQDPALLAMARPVLAELAPGVKLMEGPVAEGWKAGAPYDVILVEGAVPEIPAALPGQLRGEGGRLLAVLKQGSRIGQAVLATRMGGGRLNPAPVFDCATPVLPMLQREAGFVF